MVNENIAKRDVFDYARNSSSRALVDRSVMKIIHLAFELDTPWTPRICLHREQFIEGGLSKVDHFLGWFRLLAHPRSGHAGITPLIA